MKRLAFLLSILITFCYLVSAQVSVRSFVAKVPAGFNEEVADQYEIEIGSRINNIITLRGTSENLVKFQEEQCISVLSEARSIQPNLSRALPDMRADKVHKGIGLNSAYSGKDVIIGVTDWGFDYTHPTFYDTLLKQTRILAAWDQFKKSGPSPSGFSYGTEYQGSEELLNAQSDTFNIYQYGTHGTHVAGIAGGSGAGTEFRGVAYESQFLFTTFLVNESAVLDAFAWMQDKAEFYNKRLVINMSWGLYNLGPMDGTSLLSQAIDAYSEQGVVFVTSGGNNGGEKFHIFKEFDNDTLKTEIEFFPANAHRAMWGQSISIWGEEGDEFAMRLKLYVSGLFSVARSPMLSLSGSYLDSFIVHNTDTIFYNLERANAHSENNKPFARLRVRNVNPSIKVGLEVVSEQASLHLWNVVELTNDVGNWGLPFDDMFTGWTEGDDNYALGEPASTKSVITVAAHQSEFFLPNGNKIGGRIADFSSPGPTVDGRMKPDVSAPGVSVGSSVSSFTTNSISSTESVEFKNRTYNFARFSGTSMSGPATAGVVALMLEANGNLKPDEVKDVLKSTAREDELTGIIPEGGSPIWGAGKVNALDAVLEALNRKNADHPETTKPSFLVYPNPAASAVYLEGDFYDSFEAQLYSAQGQMIKAGNIGTRVAFSVDDLPAGMYVLKFMNGENHQKLVIARD